MHEAVHTTVRHLKEELDQGSNGSFLVNGVVPVEPVNVQFLRHTVVYQEADYSTKAAHVECSHPQDSLPVFELFVLIEGNSPSFTVIIDKRSSHLLVYARYYWFLHCVSLFKSYTNLL